MKSRLPGMLLLWLSALIVLVGAAQSVGVSVNTAPQVMLAIVPLGLIVIVAVVVYWLSAGLWAAQAMQRQGRAVAGLIATVCLILFYLAQVQHWLYGVSTITGVPLLIASLVCFAGGHLWLWQATRTTRS